MVDADPPAANIDQAIVRIMEAVGYVRKQRAPNLNYTFAGEAALIAALRPEMVAQGVFCYVLETHGMEREKYQTAKGTEMTNTVLHGVVRFMHAPSGTYRDVVASGEGSDSGDKSLNKATTGLYKYALRQTFCIETGDDPDRHPSAEQERRPTPPSTPPAARPAPGPPPKAAPAAGSALLAAKTDAINAVKEAILAVFPSDSEDDRQFRAEMLSRAFNKSTLKEVEVLSLGEIQAAAVLLEDWGRRYCDMVAIGGPEGTVDEAWEAAVKHAAQNQDSASLPIETPPARRPRPATSKQSSSGQKG